MTQKHSAKPRPPKGNEKVQCITIKYK